ncbi:hypothetical protein JCGZ_22212 [Jatropha curcas]|uniref:Uncharacterized protein n=1 Tax=Jatropha curcas TaxID=180498 RepID=A0A067JQ76_JATCU|nr:hypothetical protein JCGZ_22212 [Jatropha curcas]
MWTPQPDFVEIFYEKQGTVETGKEPILGELFYHLHAKKKDDVDHNFIDNWFQMQPRQTSTAPSNTTASTAPGVRFDPILTVPPIATVGLDGHFNASTIVGFHADRTTNDVEDDKDEDLD